MYTVIEIETMTDYKARYVAISIELQVCNRPYFKEASAAYGEEYNSV